MKISLENYKKIQNFFCNDMTSIDDLLTLLNAINKTKPIPLKSLTYYAFHANTRYKQFSIPKKSGGERIINAPVSGLKHILTPLNVVLQSIYQPQKAAHGFIFNRSVVTNAKHHVGKNYVYNIDLENFFPSIHQARIWKRLQLPPFNLNNEKIKIAELIASLVTYIPDDNNRGVLPQGAPTSPVISNIICERLDRRLLGLAKRFNLKYTRYADDMTFSSMHNVYQEDSEFIKELNRIIAGENFLINIKKTRLQKRGYRQEVTGIIVNDKTNVYRKYVKEVRALLYSIEKHGLEKAEGHFKKEYLKKKTIATIAPGIINLLAGKIEYMRMVKGSEDSTYNTLKSRFSKIIGVNELVSEQNEINSKANQIAEKSNTICEHNPRELIKILSSFTQNNNPLKYVTHSWDWGQEEERFSGYDDFIKKIRFSWMHIQPELKKLAPKLSGKISSFLLSENLGGSDGKFWGEHKISIGWSSPKLKLWCDQGNNPFEYRLEDKDRKSVNGKSIEYFNDVVNIFKYEIEIRNEDDKLKRLLMELKKKYLRFDFEVKYEHLEGIDFYTDVQWLTKGLEKIFQEISKRTEHKDVSIKTVRSINENSIEIHIVHLNSTPNRPSDELLNERDNGDFSEIMKAFCSLCDWSIEAKCTDGNFRINYLKSDNVPDLEPLDYEPTGFTHILRFYR